MVMTIHRSICALAIGIAFSAANAIAAPAAATATPAHSKPIKVVFFNPTTPAVDEMWWRVCTQFMQAAANDFKIELKVYYAGRSAAEIQRQADEALNGPNKPDFIVMQNLKKTAPSIIKQAEKQGVKVLLFNSGLSDEEADEMGTPREKFANWIGQITPDDEAAGFDLADLLVRTAKKANQTGREGKVEMLALGGTISDSSAVERNKGLDRYVRGHAGKVILNRERPLPADWDTDKAKVTLGAAYPAYPRTTAIWNANDKMAMGALDALTTRLAKAPGKDVFVGGIDWNADNLAGVKAGTIAASIGGHFMEGAWVIVLIHDYANGVDFKSQGLSLKSKMGVISKSNVSQFDKSLGDRTFEKIDKIDFTQFSKMVNPKLKAYPFDLNTILKQLQ
jgi:ABC-type sugar transport system substrate-binding protein